MQAPLPPRALDIREAAPANAAPLASGRTLVQLGAWRTQAKAEGALSAARAAAAGGDAPPPLHVVLVVVRGVGWWRLVAGPMSVPAAQALCAHLVPARCWLRSLPGAGRGQP